MIRKNIIANLVGRIWSVVSVYLFLPLYLKFLGIEAFGLVGFYSTLLGVLSLADIGLTATLSREMARLVVQENSARRMGDLIRTYETLYLCISLALMAIVGIGAPFITENWLRASALSSDKITLSIRLMGMAIALQLPANLYSGGLFGLQKQVLSNLLQIAWGVWRGGGAVLVLWLLSPTIIMFSAWQLIANAAYCFMIRYSLWRVLPDRAVPPRCSKEVLRETWNYAAGMAGICFFSSILTQTDKLVVSKMLSLETFGYYTLAGTLAMAPLILTGPISIAVFPQLTSLVSQAETATLKRLYHDTCGLVSVAVFPFGLTLALYGGPFILAWTGSAKAAQTAGLTASLLLLGSVIQAVLIIPYYLALAHGNTKLNLVLGIVSLVLITPLLIFLIMKYGIVGGGISWLTMNLCTLPPYIYFIHHHFLVGELKMWALQDIGRPLLSALPIVLLGRWFLPMPTSRIMIFGIIVLIGGISMIAAAISMPHIRKEMIARTKALFGSD